MKEIWKDVVGYEGCYKISNTARCISLDRKLISKRGIVSKYKGKEKTRIMHTSGYFTFALSSKDKIKHIFVHRLIAIAFIPNPNNKPFINHKNGIKTDNRIENLEWVTSRENLIHAIETGLQDCGIYMRGRFNGKHHGAKPILQYSKNGDFIKRWSCTAEAARKLNTYGIPNCLAGDSNTAGGFVWKRE